MILQITGSAPKQIARKLTWKQELKRSLYKKNRAEMSRHQVPPSQVWQQQQQDASQSLMHLFDSETISIGDKLQPNSCHAYYSSFVPLRIQTRFDDELAVTFPFIKHKLETAKQNDYILHLIEISEFMKKSRAKGEVDAGWQKCLRNYICDIDSLRAAELFLEFKKFGTQRLVKLHELYGAGCSREVFFERVCGSASSFRKVSPIIRSPFSVEQHEQLNEVTMPKTMKQLYCCICLIYDCNQHTLDDNLKEKQYQYVSPKNIISQQENVRRAIGICNGYIQLLEKGVISGSACSDGCYRKLGKKQWNILQMNRVKLLSPLVKGVIKLGIDMYSYNPCSIYFLLLEEKITCAHVFLFLMEEHGLMGRLQRKLLQSQTQALMWEKQIQDSYMPQPPKKGKKRIKILNHENGQSITSCAHYFRNEPPTDIQCQSCACRQRGYCLPQCLCSENCPIRKRGCGCKKQDCRTKKCICFSNNAQCDPLICTSCFGDSHKKNCSNHAIMSGEFKKVKIGRSTVGDAGLGLFAGQFIHKDQLLMIYSGELIDGSIDALRECLSVNTSLYNFGSPQGTIDARFMGNVSRFINHADLGKENLQSRNIQTQGRIKVAFYAMRDIEIDQQLFFDYDGEGLLYRNHKEKYPFIKKKDIE